MCEPRLLGCGDRRPGGQGSDGCHDCVDPELGHQSERRGCHWHQDKVRPATGIEPPGGCGELWLVRERCSPERERFDHVGADPVPVVVVERNAD